MQLIGISLCAAAVVRSTAQINGYDTGLAASEYHCHHIDTYGSCTAGPRKHHHSIPNERRALPRGQEAALRVEFPWSLRPYAVNIQVFLAGSNKREVIQIIAQRHVPRGKKPMRAKVKEDFCSSTFLEVALSTSRNVVYMTHDNGKQRKRPRQHMEQN